MKDKINNIDLSEVIPYWNRGIEWSDCKLHQYYLIAPTVEDFHQKVQYFCKEMKLDYMGDIEFKRGRLSIVDELTQALPKVSGLTAFTVSNFSSVFRELIDVAETQINSMSNDKDKEFARNQLLYKKSRFGHDYNQIPVEHADFNRLLSDANGKMVVFTWVKSSDRDAVATACGSQFTDGICEPVD